VTPTCACIQGRGELAARLCPGPTEGASRAGYGAGDGTDEPCACPCHREATPIDHAAEVSDGAR
jgi:hypothetical protein